MSSRVSAARSWIAGIPHPGSFLCVVAVFALLSFRLWWLIDVYSVNVLFWDQWDFYEALFDDQGAWELFRFQHGPHRQGIGFWLTGLVAETTAWSTRAEAFAIGGVICLAAALALGLRWRLTGELSPADIAIPLLILTPAQYGIFIHTPNPAHSAVPLLLVVLYGHALTLRAERARYGALLALNFMLIHTGFGVFAGVLTPLYFGFECLRTSKQEPGRPLGLAWLGVVIALVSGAYFFVGYEFDTSIEGFEFPSPHAIHYPRFVALMLANVCGIKGTGFWPAAAGFAVLGVTFWVLGKRGFAVIRGAAGAVDRVVVFLIGFALLFCAQAAIGRISLGLSGAQATRYVPLVVPAFLGIYLHVQATPARAWRHWLAALMVVGLIAATIPMRAGEARFMSDLKVRKDQWVEAYRATHDIDAADQASRFRIYPGEPEVTHLQAKLDALEERGLNLFRPDF